MNTPEQLQASAGEAAKPLRALGNERRLMILCQLTDGERSVGELLPLVGLSQSALSQHLAVLREAGIVEDRREGTRILYSLKLSCVLSMLRCVNRFADPASDPGGCACSLPKEEPQRRKES